MLENGIQGSIYQYSSSWEIINICKHDSFFLDILSSSFDEIIYYILNDEQLF